MTSVCIHQFLKGAGKLDLLQRCGLLGSGIFSRSLSTSSCFLGRNKPSNHIKIKRRAKEFNNVWFRDMGVWSDRNSAVYKPLDPNQGVRPAEIYFGRRNVRYPFTKMRYVSEIVKNMNVDDAINQLEYINNKAAIIIKEVLLEAQEYAVKEESVEFKSNFHIVHSFAESAGNLKFVMFGGRSRPYPIYTRFSNYYVMLREGPAPPRKKRVTAEEAALWYLENLRRRTIKDGL